MRFEFRFESVNVRNHTYILEREARSTGSAPHTRMSGDRTAPGCAAEQSATPGQLIEGRGSARIAKSTRRGRPGFGREGPGTQEQVACTQRATLPVTSKVVSAQPSCFAGHYA